MFSDDPSLPTANLAVGLTSASKLMYQPQAYRHPGVHTTVGALTGTFPALCSGSLVFHVTIAAMLLTMNGMYLICSDQLCLQTLQSCILLCQLMVLANCSL